MRIARRLWVGLGAGLAALAFVSASSATVRKVSLTASVQAGGLARLTVEVKPRARCTIAVSAATVATRSGLGAKTGGRVTWRWRIAVDAPSGQSPVVVRCGKSGTLRLMIRVTPELLPGPGRKVDVGGYRLYLECVGSGSPAVVLESGFGGPGASVPRSSGWNTLPGLLGSELRVCAYDRAGLGASDPRPAGRAGTSATLAAELRALLRAGGVSPPYVFYGPSVGAFFALSHLAHWSDPSEIAGFVFGDPGGCVTTCSGGALERVELDVTGAQQLGDRPVIALTSIEPVVGAELARRSSNGMWVEAAPGIGHVISDEAPQFVAEALRLVTGAVRAGTQLSPCEQTQLPALGGRCRSLP